MDPSRPETFGARIVQKREEAPGVITLRLQAVDGRQFNFRAGQFAMLCFKDEPDPKLRCRAYSVTSSPNSKDCIELTIKVVKEWTARMTSMPVGSEVELKFPFGKFCLGENEDEEVALIAGGVGVTPFTGMLRWLSEDNSKRKVHLFYSSHFESGLVFRRQLEEIAARWPGLDLVLSVSGDSKENPDWKGRWGRLTPELIKETLGVGTAKTKFYLCGPNAMIQTMTAALDSMGVQRENVHLENFG